MLENDDPRAAADTAGDPVESGAEHDSGEQGEANNEPTVAELQQQLREAQRREELLVSLTSRGSSRPAAEAPVNPPTAPDPRAERDLRENNLKKQALRARVAELADKDDPTSKLLLEIAEQRLEDLNTMGNALRYLHGELQEMRAEASVSESDRDGWKAWYKEHKGDYNSLDAARLGYEGHKALEAAKAPKPAANGARPSASAKPAVRQKVDISLRPMGASETRKAEVAQMKTDDFDDRIAALKAGSAEDRAEARRLEGLLNDGALELVD